MLAENVNLLTLIENKVADSFDEDSALSVVSLIETPRSEDRLICLFLAKDLIASVNTNTKSPLPTLWLRCGLVSCSTRLRMGEHITL
jgi:hypothetical protein